MMKKEIDGYIMAWVGFGMILLNALDYIFNWDVIYAGIGILGIVFLAIGVGRIKKARKKINT